MVPERTYTGHGDTLVKKRVLPKVCYLTPGGIRVLVMKKRLPIRRNVRSEAVKASSAPRADGHERAKDCPSSYALRQS
jgi:hypothetical protein